VDEFCNGSGCVDEFCNVSGRMDAYRDDSGCVDASRNGSDCVDTSRDDSGRAPLTSSLPLMDRPTLASRFCVSLADIGQSIGPSVTVTTLDRFLLSATIAEIASYNFCLRSALCFRSTRVDSGDVEFAERSFSTPLATSDAFDEDLSGTIEACKTGKLPLDVAPELVVVQSPTPFSTLVVSRTRVFGVFNKSWKNTRYELSLSTRSSNAF
jgi:hypothetical protein